MCVAAAAALTPGIVSARIPRVQMLVDTVIVLAATQGAGLAHRWVGSLPGVFVWPWLALPIAAAVIVYHVVQGALFNVIVPLVARRPVNRSWPKRALAGLPVYVLGACVAAVIVEVIDRQLWSIAPVLAAALFFALSDLCRLRAPARRSAPAPRGDRPPRTGHVGARQRRPGHALERRARAHAALLERPGARPARSTDAVPALARTELPKAVKETLEDRKIRVLNHLRLPGGHGRADRAGEGAAGRRRRGAAVARRHRAHPRGARAQAKRRAAGARGRRGERRAVGVEPADPGVLRLRPMARDDRPAGARRDRRTRGMARSRPPRRHRPISMPRSRRISPARPPVFQHEHRIRHEDGTYRRFLCRGVAVQGHGPQARSASPDR